MLLIIAISICVCITLGVMGVYWLVYKPQSAATERLRRLGGNNGGESSVSVSIPEERGTSEIVQRLASPLNRLLPPSATEAKKLQKQLMHAGFRSPGAPIVYRAIQLSSMAGFPLLVALTCAILARPLNSAIVWIIGGFVIGFFLPRYALKRATNNRQRELR